MDFELAQQYVEKMQGESIHLFAVGLLKRLPIKNSNTPTLLIAAKEDSFLLWEREKRLRGQLNLVSRPCLILGTILC